MKIFMASFGVPFYWGGATLLYLLSDILRKQEIQVKHCVFEYAKYISRNKRWFGDKWYDPYNFKSKLIVFKNNTQLFNNILSSEIKEFQPDIILSRDAVGVKILRIHNMNNPLIYILPMSSIGHMLARLGVEAVDILTWIKDNPERYNSSTYDAQRMAIACSDIVVAASQQTYTLIKFLYPECRNKITKPIWTSFLLKPKLTKKIQFSKRSIDILMAAANWSDSMKNAPLMKIICRDLQRDFNISIVGKVKKEHKVSGVNYTGLIRREKLIDLMGNSKLMLVPSIYDPGPNVAIEAIYAGCNILISKNCGNSIFFPKNIIPDLSNLNEIYVLINKSLKKQTRLKLPYTQEDILSQLLIIFKKIAKNKP